LEYSDIGKEKRGLDEVRVSEAIAQILEKYQSRIEELGIVVDVRVPEDSVLRCQKSHLSAVFGPLVANAIDALAEVPVGQKERRLHLREVTMTDRRIFEIQDTGPGMAQEVLAKVFEPFFSTKPSTGLGLGLGMAAKYLSIYNGKIKIISEPGCGTCVELFFPEP
jgi:signal transduction histidine kinase